MIYVIIFVGKVVEVAMMALRIVFISKGEKKIGSIFAFFEVSIWLAIAANVLTGLNEDPIKAIIYALGFVVGNYLGSMLDDWLGIGTAQIQIIVKEENGPMIRQALYKEGFACTKVDGEGKDCMRNVIYTIVPRKAINKVVTLAKNITTNAVITVHETKPYFGGYGIKRK